MELIYGEISIDSKNRIILPKILNIKIEELNLIMVADYVLVISPIISDIYMEKIIDNTSINYKERNKKLRDFARVCILATVNVSNDGVKRINLTSKLIKKYNLEKKVIYEIADGGIIRLWNPTSFEKYKNELIERKVKKK